MTLTRPRRSRANRPRLRTLLWPILETAAAAVIAWYLAKLLLGGRETAFAPIAAVICLGATIGQQRERALELTGGVVLGVLIADLLVRLLGSGPLQVGVMVVLAMSAAVLVGGGAMFMTETGVSAIIIGSSAAPTVGIVPVRPIEALIGGGVALAVHALVFPPDPLLHVARAANGVFSALGRALEEVAAALRTGDAARSAHALDSAPDEGDVRELEQALSLGWEIARSAPVRRGARATLQRREEISRHLDYVVRTTRLLARDTFRFTRSDGSPAPDLADAVDDLAQANWALAAVFDDPTARDEPRRFASRAAARATEASVRHADLALIQIAGHVRSAAVDLARAAEAAAPEEDRRDEPTTDELLAAPLPASREQDAAPERAG